MLKSFFVVLSLSLAAHATDYKTANCEDSGFVYGPWQDLVRLDRSIGEFLGEIAMATGQTGKVVNVTNCWLKWPVNEKKEAIPGYRTVIIDKVWKDSGKTGHAGMKILYDHKMTDWVSHDDGSLSRRHTREIRGLTFCRSPSACRELAIPFADVVPKRNETTLPFVE